MTQNPLEKIAGDLDATYERLGLGIEYLRSTPEPDWQDVLAHLKLARQCLGRDPGDRLRAQAEVWGAIEAIATADPPIGAQVARIFAQKALAQAQARAAGEGEGA